jgi:hypothetical protein
MQSMNNDARFLGVVRINTRLRRRVLVLAFYASGALGCGFSVLIHSHASEGALTWYWIGMVTGFLLLTPCWIALVNWLREYGFPGDHRLHTSRDERQEQVRHAAYVRAYWILVNVVCLGSAVVLSSPTLALPRLLAGFISKPLAALFIILVMTLPSAIMAWTEPDLKEEA